MDFLLNQSFPEELPIGTFLETPKGIYYYIKSYHYNPSALTSLSLGEFVVYVNSIAGKGIVDKGTAKSDKFIGFIGYTPKGETNNRDLTPGGLVQVCRGGVITKLLSSGAIPVKSPLSYDPATKKVGVKGNGETLIGYAVEACSLANTAIKVELIELTLN